MMTLVDGSDSVSFRMRKIDPTILAVNQGTSNQYLLVFHHLPSSSTTSDIRPRCIAYKKLNLTCSEQGQEQPSMLLSHPMSEEKKLRYEKDRCVDD